jgi:uracil-DNA glycosylase
VVGVVGRCRNLLRNNLLPNLVELQGVGTIANTTGRTSADLIPGVLLFFTPLFLIENKILFLYNPQMNKAQKLEDLHSKWKKECQCELKKTATQAVPGNGNQNADIVFIGEAPGKFEDAQGLPFVGAAGKFLAKMLAEVNLEKKDVYITSIVKYRPPGNRDPLPEEKAACRPWLMDELKIIKPLLIVFLGRHAMNNFFPELTISSAHGKLLIRPFKGISTEYFFPLYHPAAALHNGSMRATLKDDFKKIPIVLRKIKKYEKKTD